MSNKTWSIQYYLKFLEDPTHPSVGPHLKILSCIGLWRSDLRSARLKLKERLLYIIIALFFSQLIKCCFHFNADSLRLILQYAPYHLGIVKVCFFQKDKNSWHDLIEYVSSTERNQLAKNDIKHDGIIKKYININRTVSYYFWGLAFVCNICIFTEPHQRNQINVNGTSVNFNIFDVYIPFSKLPLGHYLAICIQTAMGVIVATYIIAWDNLVVTIMIFFSGQLKISRLYCSQTIDAANPIRSHENIANCHHFHTNLVKNQKLFKSLISPVMFVYLFVISVNLGVCIIEIVQIKDDLMTLISSCIFVIGCLIQLLLFYWFSNEVTVESSFTSYGTFKSDWPKSDKKLLKEIALLGLTTNERLYFKAGPCNEMSLYTFISILRASYSFYTLLNSTK